ncbi:MAG: hypothetical protein NVS1B7_3880 [Candidatus Saccharimonadales bacterium]
MEADETFDNWRTRAACLGIDPALFFPHDSAAAEPAIQAAKTVCQSCVVQEFCLEYALTNKQEYGIWGGKSETERKQIQRMRRRQQREGA